MDVVRQVGTTLRLAVPAQGADREQAGLQDFEQDLSHSERQTLEAWNKRSLYERALESIGWILENQQ